jgi:hypothetical protein
VTSRGLRDSDLQHDYSICGKLQIVSLKCQEKVAETLMLCHTSTTAGDKGFASSRDISFVVRKGLHALDRASEIIPHRSFCNPLLYVISVRTVLAKGKYAYAY